MGMREKLIDIVEWYADFLDWERKEDIVDRIMELLATDNVVPVVRCKDCKYINREIHAKGYGCLCDAHSCNREGHERYLYVDDDDFCSYGERREGE